MKGIMALLLTLWMTGMVVGQQPSNTDQFGNRNPRRSVLPNNSAANQDGGLNPAPYNQIGPLDLVLDDNLIADFRRIGQITAAVEPRGKVNGIIFKFDGNRTSPDLLTMLEPVAKQGETLYFELDDWDLQTIKTRGLQYKYSSVERARYAQVVVNYLQPGAQRGDTVSGGSSSSFPAPAPDYGPDFVGPIPQWASSDSSGQGNSGTWPANSSVGNTPNNFGSNTYGNQNFNSATNPPALSRPDFSGNNRNAFATNDFGQSRNSANSNFQTPTLQQPGADRFGTNSNQTNGLGRNSGSTMNSPGTQLAPITDNSPLAQAQREQRAFEARQAAALQRDLDLKKRELAIAENENLLKEEQLRQKELQQQLEYDQIRNNLARREATRNGSDQFGSGGVAGDRWAANSNYGDQLMNGFPIGSQRNTSNLNPRLAENTPNGGVRSLAAAIPGMNDANQANASGNNLSNPQRRVLAEANRSEDKTWGLMYFMLLFSLGLNVYLGWISRGFYVRYNELADELRETFTSTM